MGNRVETIFYSKNTKTKKKLYGRSKSSWEDNIRMEIKDTGARMRTTTEMAQCWTPVTTPLNLRNSTKSGKQRQTSSEGRYRDNCYKAWSNRRPVYGPHFQITWPMLQRVRRLASYRPNVRLKARYSHPYVCSTEAMSVTSRVSRISATSRRRTKERPSPDSVNIQCTASCS